MADSSPETPTLEYANDATDGFPGRSPEAERAIETGAGPQELRPYFRTGADAARHFVRSMSYRHSPRPPEVCEACGTTTGVRLIMMEWMAKAAPKSFEMFDEGTAYPFRTYHAGCAGCLPERPPLPRWLRWTVVGSGLSVTMCVWLSILVVLIPAQSSRSLPEYTFLGLLMYALALVACLRTVARLGLTRHYLQGTTGEVRRIRRRRVEPRGRETVKLPPEWQVRASSLTPAVRRW